MRFSLFLSLLVALSACDSTEPAAPSPLIGSWVLTDAGVESYVMSRVDQTLPDLEQRAIAGGIQIQGDATATLTHVLDAQAVTPQFVRFREGGSYAVWLDLGNNRNDPGEAVLQSPGGPIGLFTGSAGGAPVFSREGATLSIPTISLTDASGQTATASGSVTFPAVEYRAGEETTLREHSYPHAVGDTLHFHADGTFRVSGDRTPFLHTAARWRSESPGSVTFLYENGGVILSAFAYRIEEGTLALDYLEDADAETRERLETPRLAAPGSFAAVRRGYVYRARPAQP